MDLFVFLHFPVLDMKTTVGHYHNSIFSIKISVSRLDVINLDQINFGQAVLRSPLPKGRTMFAHAQCVAGQRVDDFHFL